MVHAVHEAEGEVVPRVVVVTGARPREEAVALVQTPKILVVVGAVTGAVGAVGAVTVAVGAVTVAVGVVTAVKENHLGK